MGSAAAAACKSCGAPIFWASTAKGKAMPVDLEPASSGNLVLADGDPREPSVRAATAADRALPHYTSHFATCAHADAHRKPRTKPGATP